MGEINKALGMGSELEHKGKVYKLSPFTFRIQGAFEQYMEGEAYLEYRRNKEYLTPEEQEKKLAQIGQDITAGVYSFGNGLLGKAFGSLKHLKYLLFLALQAQHPEATPALAAEMVEEQLQKVMEKLTEANADPTKAPAAT